MPRLSSLFLLFIFSFQWIDPLSAALQVSPLPLPSPGTPSIQACFTPPRGCLSWILKALGKAKKRIYVQAYSFTSLPIAQALESAHRRGIDVQIILDKSQVHDRHSRLLPLAHKGLPIFIDPVPGIAHNKVMIIDEEWVITGSYNFTNAAETRNAENLLILRDKPTAHAFLENWYGRRAHSYRWNEEYIRPGVDLALWIKDMMDQLKYWIE